MAILVLVLTAVASAAAADGGLFMRASESGTCGGDFGTVCSHTEHADQVTGRLSVDARILSTEAGLVPADGFSEAHASVGVDHAWPSGAQAVDVTVVVAVTRADILRKNGVLSPPLWTDLTPSSIRLVFRAAADGCECAPVERVVAVEGTAATLGSTTVVLHVSGAASLIHVDVILSGLARLSHDVAGSPSFPDKGSVRTQADVTVQQIGVAAA